jgi:hypothetical protein
VRQQDPDGCWRRFEHNGVPHTYNTRATWALLATGRVAGDAPLVDAASRNLEWALAQQTEAGWFDNNAFTADAAPFTHTIAYTIRGFLECGVLLGEERYLQAAEKAAHAVARTQRDDGWVAGAFGCDWQTTARYCCLTGVAQMALNWIRLGQERGARGLVEHARLGLAFLKREQIIGGADPVVRGAIAGSAPIWGAYSRFEFPNWAAKFFADGLMMDMTDTAIPPVAKQFARPKVAAHV